jgi:hypothetical protein
MKVHIGDVPKVYTVNYRPNDPLSRIRSLQTAAGNRSGNTLLDSAIKAKKRTLRKTKKAPSIEQQHELDIKQARSKKKPTIPRQKKAVAKDKQKHKAEPKDIVVQAKGVELNIPAKSIECSGLVSDKFEYEPSEILLSLLSKEEVDGMPELPAGMVAVGPMVRMTAKRSNLVNLCGDVDLHMPHSALPLDEAEMGMFATAHEMQRRKLLLAEEEKHKWKMKQRLQAQKALELMFPSHAAATKVKNKMVSNMRARANRRKSEIKRRSFFQNMKTEELEHAGEKNRGMLSILQAMEKSAKEHGLKSARRDARAQSMSNRGGLTKQMSQNNLAQALERSNNRGAAGEGGEGAGAGDDISEAIKAAVRIGQEQAKKAAEAKAGRKAARERIVSGLGSLGGLEDGDEDEDEDGEDEGEDTYTDTDNDPSPLPKTRKISFTPKRNRSKVSFSIGNAPSDGESNVGDAAKAATLRALDQAKVVAELAELAKEATARGAVPDRDKLLVLAEATMAKRLNGAEKAEQGAMHQRQQLMATAMDDRQVKEGLQHRQSTDMMRRKTEGCRKLSILRTGIVLTDGTALEDAEAGSGRRWEGGRTAKKGSAAKKGSLDGGKQGPVVDKMRRADTIGGGRKVRRQTEMVGGKHGGKGRHNSNSIEANLIERTKEQEMEIMKALVGQGKVKQWQHLRVLKFDPYAGMDANAKSEAAKSAKAAAKGAQGAGSQGAALLAAGEFGAQVDITAAKDGKEGVGGLKAAASWVTHDLIDAKAVEMDVSGEEAEDELQAIGALGPGINVPLVGWGTYVVAAMCISERVTGSRQRVRLLAYMSSLRQPKTGARVQVRFWLAPDTPDSLEDVNRRERMLRAEEGYWAGFVLVGDCTLHLQNQERVEILQSLERAKETETNVKTQAQKMKGQVERRRAEAASGGEELDDSEEGGGGERVSIPLSPKSKGKKNQTAQHFNKMPTPGAPVFRGTQMFMVRDDSLTAGVEWAGELVCLTRTIVVPVIAPTIFTPKIGVFKWTNNKGGFPGPGAGAGADSPGGPGGRKASESGRRYSDQLSIPIDAWESPLIVRNKFTPKSDDFSGRQGPGNSPKRNPNNCLASLTVRAAHYRHGAESASLATKLASAMGVDVGGGGSKSLKHGGRRRPASPTRKAAGKAPAFQLQIGVENGLKRILRRRSWEVLMNVKVRNSITALMMDNEAKRALGEATAEAKEELAQKD